MFVLSILYLLLSNTIITTIDALGPLASVDVPDELLLVQLLMLLLLQLPRLLLKKKLQWLRHAECMATRPRRGEAVLNEEAVF